MTNREQRPTEDAWTALVRDAWRGPEPTPNQRVAFDARLDERLLGSTRTPWLRTAGVIAGAAIALLVWNEASTPTVVQSEAIPVAGVDDRPSAEEFADTWLALGQYGQLGQLDPLGDAADTSDASLPDDYAAIDSLLLGS